MQADSPSPRRTFPAELRFKRARTAGFSLVELMVSISVLAVLGGLVAQLMGSATKLTSNSKQTSDCDSEARYALGQISSDLLRRVRRPDVDCFLEKKTGNDRLFLFSETPGYSPTLTEAKRSTVALIGYRIKQVTAQGRTTFELQRYARALPWVSTTEEKAMPFVVLSNTPPFKPVTSTTLGGSDGKGSGGSFVSAINEQPEDELYYQTVAENVFRFEVSLLKKPDVSATVTPGVEARARVLTDAEIPLELSKYGFTNISSVVVTIAVIDSKNANRVGPDDLGRTLTLPDSKTTIECKYPLEEWNTVFSSAIPSLPKPMAAGVRFYQRVISL